MLVVKEVWWFVKATGLFVKLTMLFVKATRFEDDVVVNQNELKG